ncbi:MAG: metal ABC transporter substrate-binding protein [Phycisphaerales bacterium]|jgi:ABC-type Zn uptake system ZnuABC Zn-binding protein ZnuA|nr:metal ABC transporter substrate-binding protein [Phycisphaerales bacterium]
MPTTARRPAIALLASLAAMLLTACGDPKPAARAAGPARVVVSIPPMEGLIRPMLPEGAEVRVLCPPGRSVHGYEPTPDDAAAVARADLVVMVGLGLEPGVERLLSSRSQSPRRVLRFSEAVGVGSAPAAHDHSEHDHDHEAHDHGHDDHDGHDGHDHGVDPHLWLDPTLAKRFVGEAANAIVTLPAGADGSGAGDSARVNAARDELVARLDALDAAYRERLAPLAGRPIITEHMAFARLAERYGLVVPAVLRPIEGEPTPEAIAAAVRAVRDLGAPAIFTEPQFDPTLARRVSEAAGVPLGVLDPEGAGDYFAMMEKNLAEMVRLLGPGATGG